jgi:hypothetical protein
VLPDRCFVGAFGLRARACCRTRRRRSQRELDGRLGPGPNDRNDVMLELSWDGMSLTGTINPDTAPVEIANATFDPATGAITMEADVDANGTTVHYMIEGQLDGDSMTGSWSHDDREGDFSITRSE